MKEMIVVAGSSKVGVCRLRRCLRECGYSSIPCKTVEKLIEELEVLPTCDVSVPLVIIEPDILKSLSDDLIAWLSDFSLDVPFLLACEEELQAELAEIFEKICEYRAGFIAEQNGELTKINLIWQSLPTIHGDTFMLSALISLTIHMKSYTCGAFSLSTTRITPK